MSSIPQREQDPDKLWEIIDSKDFEIARLKRFEEFYMMLGKLNTLPSEED